MCADGENGTVLQAIDKGASLMIYATIFQTSPFSVLSRPDEPVRTLSDFVGKTIAPRPATHPLLSPLLVKHGIDRKSIKLIPSGPDPSQLVNPLARTLRLLDRAGRHARGRCARRQRTVHVRELYTHASILNRQEMEGQKNDEQASQGMRSFTRRVVV